MRTREIAKIGNILFQSVPLEETRRKLKIGQLQKDWIKIAGPAAAAHSAPWKLEYNELWLIAEPGGWLQNLVMMENILLKKVKTWWGDGSEVITRIRVMGRRPEPIFYEDDSLAIAQNIKIAPVEEDWQWAIDQTNEIEDPKLAARVRESLAHLKAMERKKFSDGMVPCQKCQIPVLAEEKNCVHCLREIHEENRKKLRETLWQCPWLKAKELAAFTNLSLRQAQDVRRDLLGDLAKKVPYGKEMSNDGLTLVMLITGKRPENLTEELIQTVWDRIQREIRGEVIEEVKDILREYPETSLEKIQETRSVSPKEYGVARRQLLEEWRSLVPIGRERGALGLKAVSLASGQIIEEWEEEKIAQWWEKIRKGDRYVFTYRPGKNGSTPKNNRNSGPKITAK